MVFAGSLWAGWNKGPVAHLVEHLDNKFCKHLPNHPSNKAPDHAAATTASSISETRNLLADMQDAPSDSGDVEVTAGFNSPASSPPPSDEVEFVESSRASTRSRSTPPAGDVLELSDDDVPISAAAKRKGRLQLVISDDED